MPKRPLHRLLVAAAALGLVTLPTAPVAVAQLARRAATVDSIVAAAEDAIRRDRPWRATLALRPLTEDFRTRSPRVMLAAARAAAGWRGWTEVVRLLADPAWVTDTGSAEGFLLLARAFLESGRAGDALAPARRGLVLVPETDRGAAMVSLGRIHERLGRADSAARWLLLASEELPGAADWLLLRAAPGIPDSVQREAVYRRIELATAQARIPWSEALALERHGQPLAAAARYDALGDRIAAIRLRFGHGDSAARATARRALMEVLGDPDSDAVSAIGLFDRAIRDPTDSEQLVVARRAAKAGLTERAVTGFARAGRLTDHDRLTYAGALVRLGHYLEALPVLDAIRTPPLRATAAYERARVLLRSGQPVAAITALANAAEQHAGDAEWAARALFLKADLIGDRLGDDSARRAFRLAHERHPSTTFGRRAGFQAAVIAFVSGNAATAAAEFDRLSVGPHAEERTASLYWAGRAHERAGDSATARARWLALTDRDGDSYYAVLAGRRTGREPWRFDRVDREQDAEFDESLLRVALLERLGLEGEAGLELADFAARAAASPTAMADASRRLHLARYYSRSVRLAIRAQRRGAPWNAELARLQYPLPFEDVMVPEARTAGIDPLLVAALIRQESAFDVRARSAADARGLMQVLPSVGAAYAARAGIADFDPVLLYQPDLNLDFGIEHLAEAIDRFGATERALAAYNAGADRVARWLQLPGAAEDPEVFVERIPFAETRDYVRRVTRNHAMYRALYLASAP